MTMSPAHGVDAGMEEIAKNIQNPTIRTCFDVCIGKRSAKIWDDDIKSRKSLKRVSKRLVGKKKPAFSFSYAASRILGCESKKDAKFCVVCGALFILGTALLIVLGFEPVKITVIFEGGESRVLHVAQRKQKRISKARIVSVHVEPLHPVLDHDRYDNMCSKSTIVGDRKLLTVTFSKVTLEFLEDKIGVLCHCGKKMSRSSLETHLRPSFGPFKAAIKERRSVDIEGVSFNDCVFSGGRIKRVAEAGQVCNTWNLKFIPTISGTFDIAVNTRLVKADPITLEAGIETLVHLEGRFVSGTQAKEVRYSHSIVQSLSCLIVFL